MIPEALNRDGFITNLKEAHTRLLILKEDIKYPLSEERQKWLDGATLLIGHLHRLEMRDDIEAVLREVGEHHGRKETENGLSGHRRADT
ncbi:MAG TPA: hypothetical protein VLH56_18035 [Dissulfurispiraceae bacterium]|nr:hypothetical protein [Dissulfurispiraceae bacterium]